MGEQMITKVRMTIPAGSVVLNPDDEFEAVLIAIANTHRAKTEGYGSEEDSLANFAVAARIEGTTPLDAMDGFVLKHQAAYDMWKQGDRKKNKYSDDAVIDQAVYGVIRVVLYKRGAY